MASGSGAKGDAQYSLTRCNSSFQGADSIGTRTKGLIFVVVGDMASVFGVMQLIRIWSQAGCGFFYGV